MSSLTKQAIIACTVELASEKPIKKITVRDIVSACGITRNSFYYYFHDIFDVLDQAVRQQVEHIQNSSASDIDQAIFDLIESMVMHKKVWRNLYKTLDKDTLSRYVTKWLHGIFVGYITSIPGGKEMSELDLNIICAFYEEALFGVLSRWVINDGAGSPEEMQEIAKRIRVIFDGTIELMVNNSAK